MGKKNRENNIEEERERDRREERSDLGKKIIKGEGEREREIRRIRAIWITKCRVTFWEYWLIYIS